MCILFTPYSKPEIMLIWGVSQYLTMLPWWFELLGPGIGTIRQCGLVKVGVTLLEGVCHWEWALKFQKLIPDPGAPTLQPSTPHLHRWIRMQLLAISPAPDCPLPRFPP